MVGVVGCGCEGRWWEWEGVGVRVGDGASGRVWVRVGDGGSGRMWV